jgi:hypothetical protein
MIDLNTINCIKNNDFIPFPKGGVFDFYGMDTEESYVRNSKRQPKDWYYRHNDIKYTLNSYGYRTKEFEDVDWKNSIVIFGCSHIFGIGNDDSHTISYFLEKLTKIPVINLGFPAASIQFCLHNSLMLFNKYGVPKSVIYSWPSITRHLLYRKDSVYMSTKFDDISEHPPEAIAAIEEITGSSFSPVDNPKVIEHLIPFNIVNTQLIKNMWQDKCPLYEFSAFPTTSKILECEFYNRIPNDYARDLVHFGRHTNKLFAENICKNLEI